MVEPSKADLLLPFKVKNLRLELEQITAKLEIEQFKRSFRVCKN
jgi:hypothetical protein